MSQHVRWSVLFKSAIYLSVVAVFLSGAAQASESGTKKVVARRSDDGVAQSMDATGKRLETLRVDLGLSAEQVKGMNDMSTSLSTYLMSSGDQIRKNRASLDRALYQVSPDFGEAHAIKQKLNALDLERIERKIQFISDMKKLLTQEQFAKWIVKYYPTPTQPAPEPALN